METDEHRQLKLASLAVLRAVGYESLAVEVACPGSSFRVDVAGYRAAPAALPEGGGGPPSLTDSAFDPLRTCRTVIVECKRSRGDFLRDGRHLQDLIVRRCALNAFRRELEVRILRVAEPHLRGAGSMLFAELEEWDYAASRLPSYHRVLRELRSIDKQVHGQTKFWAMARYGLADALVIAAPAGLIAADEVPPGWGLLEFTGLSERPSVRRLRWESAELDRSNDPRRARLLRNIAIAATREAWRDRLPELDLVADGP